jgi:hypothetical protein
MPIVTLKDIKQACQAQTKAAAAGRAKDSADAKKKAANMRVFEALLGVKTEDEVRALSPKEMKRIVRQRVRAGQVELDGISAATLLDKVIQKSKSERRPSWRDNFVYVHGESKALEIQQATPETFSYRFVGSGL